MYIRAFKKSVDVDVAHEPRIATQRGGAVRVNARRVGIYKQFCRQFSGVWAHADSLKAAHAKADEFGVGNPITKEVSNIVAPCS